MKTLQVELKVAKGELHLNFGKEEVGLVSWISVSCQCEPVDDFVHGFHR